MSAPEGENGALTQDEAIERIRALVDDDRDLHGVVNTGGETDYAYIYLASVTGEYRGNEMLWLRYVWLSKPGAYESDMWGENGISIRMVDGMAEALPSLFAATCNGMKAGGRGDAPPYYAEVGDTP